MGGRGRAELSKIFAVGLTMVLVKQSAEFFEGKDPKLIYIARRLGDALELEDVLTQADLDFGVETDTYTGGIIFRTERTGAFFYVLAADAPEAYRVLLEHGFRPAADEA